MKILFLGSKEYPFGVNAGEDEITSGGIEKYVEVLVNELAKQGTQVTVVSRGFGVEGSKRLKNVEVVRVPWLKGFFLRNPSFNFLSFLKALSIDFDCIHAHGVVASLFGIMLARVKGKPIVATPHGVSKKQPQYNVVVKTLIGALERFAYARADLVVFLSEGERAMFAEEFGFIPKSTVIPPAINLGKYVPSKKRSVRVIFVGRLIAVKGLRFLLEAMRSVSAELLIVGEGPERKELEGIAGPNVRFLGHRRDVERLLSENEIFVLPSLSEGMPIALLEALASGCACVVTDVGLPVKNKVNALVVEPGNAVALSSALNRLLQDKELRKRLELNARDLSRSFSLHNLAKRHREEVYALLARI